MKIQFSFVFVSLAVLLLTESSYSTDVTYSDSYVVATSEGIFSRNNTAITKSKSVNTIKPLKSKNDNDNNGHKKDAVNESDYIANNILNFSLQMPVFAGLKWDDNYYTVLTKLQSVPGLQLIKNHCTYNFDSNDMKEYIKSLVIMPAYRNPAKIQSEIQSEGPILAKKVKRRKSSEPIPEYKVIDFILYTNINTEIIYNGNTDNFEKPSSLSNFKELIDAAKILTDSYYIDSCVIGATVTLAGTKSFLEIFVGKVYDGSDSSYPDGILNKIYIHVPSDKIGDVELYNLFESKYKDYRHGDSSNVAYSDKFDNSIILSKNRSDSGDEGVDIIYSKSREAFKIQTDNSNAKLDAIKKEILRKQKVWSNDPSADSSL